MHTQVERETFKVDPGRVKPGDLMAIIYYVKVDSVGPTGASMTVQDLSNDTGKISINGVELIRNSLSADFFEKEEKVTMTRAAEILISSPNRPLTVVFEKKDGSERVLRGRFVRHEALMGRSMVEDLDVAKTDKEDGLRQVDHRTIRSLIVDGVKYNVNRR